MGVKGRLNYPVGRAVYAKRFFAQKVFASRQNVRIDLVMQVVRHGAVNCFHFVIGQQLIIVIRHLSDRWHIFGKPIRQSRVEIAYGNNFRSRFCVRQVQPSGCRGGKFSPHQATTDHAKFDYPCHAIIPSAVSTLALSWTTAISARVIPAGFS